MTTPGWAACKRGDEHVDHITIDDTPPPGADPKQAVEVWAAEQLRTGRAITGGIRVRDDGRIEPVSVPTDPGTSITSQEVTHDGSGHRHDLPLDRQPDPRTTTGRTGGESRTTSFVTAPINDDTSDTLTLVRAVDGAPICPACNEPVRAIVCGLQRATTAEARDAIDHLLIAAHRKLAGH